VTNRCRAPTKWNEVAISGKIRAGLAEAHSCMPMPVSETDRLHQSRPLLILIGRSLTFPSLVKHPHSITSSARASSEGGTVRRSILAVSALMTSSNLEGCTTGKSAGLEPLRMRLA
jgi:hypothetical protein